MKDKTWELLNLYLDRDFRLLPMAPNRSSEQDIRDVEDKLGIKFPDEYKVHLLGYGDNLLEARGIYIEVLEGIWERPKVFDVGPFWSFLYGLHTYTASKESDDWMRLEVAGNKFFAKTGIKATPILKVIGDADVYCVDERSQIVIYRHEENNVEFTNMIFWEVLEFELIKLKERKDRRIKEDKR